MFTLTFIKQWIFGLKRQLKNQQQETIDLEDYSNDARWPIDKSLNDSIVRIYHVLEKPMTQ